MGWSDRLPRNEQTRKRNEQSRAAMAAEIPKRQRKMRRQKQTKSAGSEFEFNEKFIFYVKVNNEYVITEQLRRKRGCIVSWWNKKSPSSSTHPVAKCRGKRNEIRDIPIFQIKAAAPSLFVSGESFAAKWISNEFPTPTWLEQAQRSFNIWHSLCEQHLYLLSDVNLWHLFGCSYTFFLFLLLLCHRHTRRKGIKMKVEKT